MLLGLMLIIVMPEAQGGVIEHGSTWEGKIISPRGNNNHRASYDKSNHDVGIKRKLNHNYSAEYAYNNDGDT